MSKGETIIQLLKIAFAIYFVHWSREVIQILNKML